MDFHIVIYVLGDTNRPARMCRSRGDDRAGTRSVAMTSTPTRVMAPNTNTVCGHRRRPEPFGSPSFYSNQKISSGKDGVRCGLKRKCFTGHNKTHTCTWSSPEWFSIQDTTKLQKLKRSYGILQHLNLAVYIIFRREMPQELHTQLSESKKGELKESFHHLLKWAWRYNKNLEEQAAQLHMLTSWSKIVETFPSKPLSPSLGSGLSSSVSPNATRRLWRQRWVLCRRAAGSCWTRAITCRVTHSDQWWWIRVGIQEICVVSVIRRLGESGVTEEAGQGHDQG